MHSGFQITVSLGNTCYEFSGLEHKLFVDTEDDTLSHITGNNIYNYKRDIHAAFFEYSTELNDKWSIKPGVRLEYVNKNIEFWNLVKNNISFILRLI